MIRNLASLLLSAVLTVIALWSVGAMLGVIAVGYCMVAGC